MAPRPDVSGVTEEPVVLRGVWKTYGTAVALRDVTMRARSGRVLALLGPNGAGKSTVLRIAAGVTRPTRGTVRVQGADPRPDGVRRVIGFAGHRTFLYGALTAEENLRFYAELYGISASAVAPALERFGLGPLRRRRVQELSRGLAQRLNLARALLHDPRIVLLDEPFTGLDAAFTTHLAASLRDLRADGCTVLLATHEWDTARELADDAVVFVQGRLVLRTAAAALAPSELPALYAGSSPS
jgi:heme ABC exporter ATP-binding subunit CcmA